MNRIVPVTKARMAEATDAVVSAFANDPLMEFFWPDSKLRAACLRPMMEANIRLTLPDGHTWGIEVDGRIAGVIGVVPPGCYPQSVGRILRYMAALVVRPHLYLPPRSRLLTHGPRYMRQWEEQHYIGRHWYVYLLGVHRDFQGRGLGRLLMRHAMEFSKVDRVPCFLETQTEKNVAFYQSMGFEMTTEAYPTEGGPKTWALLNKCVKY